MPALAAIPLLVSFAEAAGIVVSGVATAAGIDILSNKVEEYIEENPEQSQKIFNMIMPAQGLANILKNESSEGKEISEEELGEIDVKEKPKLTGKEKSERIKATIRRARAGKGNYSSPDATGPAVDIGGSVIREVEDMGIADKNLKDNYDPDKPKFDFTKFYKNRRRKADGGAIGIEILFGPKRDNFRYGGDTMGGKNDKSKTSKGPDRSAVGPGSTYANNVANQNDGGGGITNTINNINKTTVFDKAKNLANKVVDSPLTAFIDPRSKLALAMGGYKYLRDGVTPFQQKSIDEELEDIQTKEGIVPYADGGRVGLFMGGSPLDGQALSIYDSMKSYNFSDQEIANALSAQGLYTAGGSTPETTAPNIINQQLQTGGGGDNNFGGQGIGAFGNLDPNTKQTMQVEVADGMGGVTIKEVNTYLDAGGLRKTLDNKNPVNAGIDVKPMAVTIMEALMGKKNDSEFDPAGKIYGTFNNPNYKDLSFFGKIKTDYSRQKELKQLQKEFELQEKLKEQIKQEAIANANKPYSGPTFYNSGNVNTDGGTGGAISQDFQNTTASIDNYSSDVLRAKGGMVGYKDGGLITMFKEKR